MQIGSESADLLASAGFSEASPLSGEDAAEPDFGPSCQDLLAEDFADACINSGVAPTCAMILRLADRLLSEAPDLDDRFASGKSVSAGLHQKGSGGLRKVSSSHPTSVRLINQFVSHVAPIIFSPVLSLSMVLNHRPIVTSETLFSRIWSSPSLVSLEVSF